MAFPVFLKHSEQAGARKAGWVGLGLLALAWCASAPAEEPRAAAEWTVTVVAEDLPAVDNLAFTGDGRLYATLEAARDGRLVRVDGGRMHTVLGDLDRPDGLCLRGRRAYVTEEVANGRVLEVDLDTGTARTLARLRAPEGVAILANGDALVAEDRADGRLVRIRPDGTIETLVASLRRPEGIAIGADGDIYIAETGTGRILRYANGVREVAVAGLANPDQVAVAADGALWITEDARPGRLLRFVDGHLESIVTGLAFPQGIALAPDGRVFVAEQGRGRVLAIARRRAP